jgi:hypothetical protein
MTLRTVLIVAVVALAGAAGFWIGARQAQLTLEDSDTGKTDEPLRLPDGTNPRIPSLPTSVPEAAVDEAVAESIDDPKTALKKTLAVRDQDTRRHQLTRLGWVWGSTSPEEPRNGSRRCRGGGRHGSPIRSPTPLSRNSRAKHSHGRCASAAHRDAICGPT